MANDVVVDDLPAPVEATKPSFTIPDFQADEAALKALEIKIAHLVSISIQAGMEAVRVKHAARRRELVTAATFYESLARNAAAKVTAATKMFNACVNRETTDRKAARAAPTLFFEDFVTLGRAGRLHHAMLRAEEKSAKAAKQLREAQLEVEKHDGLLIQLLMAREAEWRRHFESDEGQAEIRSDQRIAKLAAQVDAIHAERRSFEKRLAAGRVSIDELRAREMCREKLAFLAGNVEGLYFNGQAKYEDSRYFRLRDRTGRDWLLDWDDELIELDRFEFNITHMDDGSYTVERASWTSRRVGESRLHDPKRPLTDGVDLRLIAALRRFVLELTEPSE